MATTKQKDEIIIKPPPLLRRDASISSFKQKQGQELLKEIKSHEKGVGGIRPPSSFLISKHVLIVGDSFTRLFGGFQRGDERQVPTDVVIIKYSGSPAKSLTRMFPSDLKEEKQVGEIGEKASISKKIIFKGSAYEYKCDEKKVKECLVRVDVDILRELNRDREIQNVVFYFGNVDCHSSYFYKILQEDRDKLMEQVEKTSLPKALESYNKKFVEDCLTNYIRFLSILCKDFNRQVKRICIICPSYSPVDDRYVIDSIFRFPLKSKSLREKNKLFESNFGYPSEVLKKIYTRANRNQVVDLFIQTLKEKISKFSRLNAKVKIIDPNPLLATPTGLVKKDFSPPINDVDDFHIFDNKVKNLKSFFYQQIFY